MEKTAYIAQIRGAVLQDAREAYSEIAGQVPLALSLLAEQYASITEADGLSRYEFTPAILERAYDAATHAGSESNPGAASTKLLKSWDVESYYEQALPLAPAVLQRVFAQLRPR